MQLHPFLFLQIAEGSRLAGAFLFLTPSEKLRKTGEVFLEDKTDTLRVQRVAREVAVVSLIVNFYSKISIREYQVADVKVTNE